MFESAALRFDKPAKHAVVDLINQTHSMFLGYDELTLDNVRAIEGASKDQLNTRIEARFGTAPTPPTTDLRYRRLHLGDYLQARHRFFEVDGAFTDAQVLLYLHTAHQILIDLADCAITRASTPNVDGSLTVTVTPIGAHPVWIGAVSLFAAPAGHVGLLIRNTRLKGLRVVDFKTPV